MPACPACQRPVALLRATCFYCGGALPTEETVTALQVHEAARDPGPPEPTDSGRTLVVIWLQDQDAGALARVLDLDLYDARQRVTRGGAQLWRNVLRAEAQAEVQRLRAAGIEALPIDERDVRQAGSPIVVAGGARDASRLQLRAGPQTRQLEQGDLLLVVQGPIAREVQADPDARTSSKRPQRAPALESGYRFHLHLRGAGERPLELDPAAFEFEQAADGRAPYLTLRRWIETLAPSVPVDDGFRLVAPALAPADPDSLPSRWAGMLAAHEGEGRRRDRAWLDNLAQFRFHSAWRAIVERRRAAAGSADAAALSALEPLH
jgi:hypothetical protein